METAITQFILQHAHLSTAELALLLSKKSHLPKEFIINQVNGLQKAKHKFPFLSRKKNYIFPTPRAVAQSSSEITARYKSDILKATTVADLSGGMGIDSYFFSKYSTISYYVELNTSLVQLVKSNFEVLGSTHIKTYNTSAAKFLEDHQQPIELIYIDPDRRTTVEKAFKVNECEPNVAELLPLIWGKTENCMIKLSPMLDISQALTQLPHCKEVHIVSVRNECKELLFLLQKGSKGIVTIKTVNYTNEKQELYDFSFSSETKATVSYSSPAAYLYEPNSSIMKGGAFKSIAKHFNLKKLAPNTHLYTSSEIIHNFPGRKLEISSISKPKKGVVSKANVVCRNFSLSTEQLKKKYKISDGGSQFLYAAELSDKEKVFILCKLV